LRDAVEPTEFTGGPKLVDDIVTYIERIARGME
jgi:hypothetical protein